MSSSGAVLRSCLLLRASSVRIRSGEAVGADISLSMNLICTKKKERVEPVMIIGGHWALAG